MFDIAGSELLVIGVVALIVIGPKELPGLLRQAGAAMNKVRRMAGEFRGQFDEAMREAELDQAKKAFTDVNEAAQSATSSFNPLDSIRNEIKAVKEEVKGRSASPVEPSMAEPVIAPPPPAPAVDIKPDVPSQKPKAKPASKTPAKTAAKTAAKPAENSPGRKA